MANHEPLNQRIRQILAKREKVSERKMFGGACFMIDGNMCVGTWKGSLIVRLEKKNHDRTLAEPYTKPADMNGRVMKGWALVEPAGIESENDLTVWVDKAARFAESLPPKCPPNLGPTSKTRTDGALNPCRRPSRNPPAGATR